MADTLALGASGAIRRGSSPLSPTNLIMKTLNEAKESTKHMIKSRDMVVIHNGASDDHKDAELCWCKPLVMTGKEFLESSFDW